MKLITVLKDFSEMKLEEFTNENLTNRFSNIAKTILYDGYIRVRNDYRVYVKTVEFYFHAENDSPMDERPWNFTRTNDVWPKEIKQYMMYSE